MKKSYSSLLIASLGAFALAAGVRSAADDKSALDLDFPPVMQEEAPEKRDARIVAELYARYIDCLQSVGREELCYWSWRAECEKIIPWRCEQLELEMFGDPTEGEEFCSLNSKQPSYQGASRLTRAF